MPNHTSESTKQSKSKARKITQTTTTIIPRSFTLEHYSKILFNSDFFIYLKNSLIVSFSSMIISIILSVSAAYGLHKLKFYGNKFVEYSLLVTYALMGHSAKLVGAKRCVLYAHSLIMIPKAEGRRSLGSFSSWLALQSCLPLL